MLINNSRGSEWRKCDLHMHSTASDGTATPQQLVDEAVNKKIEIIALTDHHTVDKVDEIKAYGLKQGITVISGIEFRTEYGQKSVHMIGLFPDSYNGLKLTQDALYDLILSPLNLTKTIIRKEGRAEHPEYSDDEAFKEGLMRVQVDFKTAADLIHKYGGIVTVHAGGKANSFDEEMRHEGTSKKNVSIADSLGPVKEELLRDYIDVCEVRNSKEAIFYLETWNKPCIAASDAHSISEVARNYCWIKCEPSFEGVKQIIYEPKCRVNIQIDKPEEKPDYLVIDRIEINHRDFGYQVIPFNQGLNTIIGGRSSGKSVLLGCIARLCGDKKPIKPNKSQYDTYINSVSQTTKIYWRDLGEETDRKIDFFPQSHIIEMASDPKKIRELVEDIMRDENGENKELTALKGKLETTIVLIHSLFSDYRKKSNELATWQSDIRAVGNKEGIQQEILKIEANILEIKAAVEDGLSDYDLTLYNTLKERISELKDKGLEYQNSKEAVEALRIIPLFADTEYSLGLVQSEELRMRLTAAYNQLKEETSRKWITILEDFISETGQLLTKSKSDISEIEKNPVYIRAIKVYEENTKLVEESSKLEKEKEKITKIDRLTDRIEQAQKDINGILDKIISCYDELYSSQVEYCNTHVINKGDVTITPRVVFQTKQFQENANKYFDGRSTKNNDVLSFKFESAEQFRTFVEEMLGRLIQNDYVLKSGNNHIETAESVFSSNPFMIEYNINYQGDDLADMSEGKTAFVILRLLLDFSTNEYPILIDQPEDDLDNRAIFGDLVTYLREKKIKRQIILVTHNPNVVVGADAEEIIVANQQGSGNINPEGVKFAYVTGALEDSFIDDNGSVLLNQGIREHVCDLLEGGDKAFKLRELKYQLSKQVRA